MNAPAATVSPPAGLTAEFPGWLPAMLVKELRQGLRAKGFVATFLIFHLVAVVVFWWTLEINSASGLRETFNWLNGVFWGLLNLMLLLVVPLRGLGGLRQEIEQRTLDLLMLTRMTAWRIVLGKWIALVAQAALFLAALLPYGVVRYFFGSVDLQDDLRQAAGMFGVSITIAAAALWVSALPKLFRILMPIGLFFAVQSMGMATVLMATVSGRTRAGVMRSPFQVMDLGAVAVIVLLLLTFLGLAVRRIAPPAENHSVSARLLALVVLLGAAVSSLVLRGFGGSNFMIVGLLALMIVAAVELARDCLPMGSHWRWWHGRGKIRAALGRLFLPGWVSAGLFAAFGLGLLALLGFVLKGWQPPRMSASEFAWWLVLAWQALVFPALLLSFLPTTSTMRMGGTGYFVIQGLFATFSLLSANNAAGYFAGEGVARVLSALCEILPVSSFWLGANLMQKDLTVPHLIGQGVVFATLLWLYLRQAQPYWRQLNSVAQRIATSAPPAP